MKMMTEEDHSSDWIGIAEAHGIKVNIHIKDPRQVVFIIDIEGVKFKLCEVSHLQILKLKTSIFTSFLQILEVLNL